MAQPYTRVWSVASGNPIVVPHDEEPHCFELGFMPAGKVTRLAVKQVGGTARAFVVDLFDMPVCGLYEPGNSLSLAPTALSDELAKIIPTQSQTTPGAAVVFNDGAEYPYRNRVGSYCQPERAVYLRINVTTPADVTTWEVSLTALPADS